MRWALIENQLVVNVVEQNTQPEIGGVWVACDDAGPGWTYDGSKFISPFPPLLPQLNIITKIAMITRFTDAEFVGILAAAKTDVEVENWYARFSAANTINLDDQRTQDGIAVLVTKNLLQQTRADAILTDPVQPGERP